MNPLLDNVAAFPDQTCITFVDGKGRDQGSLTFGQLHRQAERIAAYLRGAQALGPGDRALMLYTPSLEFVTALAGCLLAGIIPVPACPPDPSNLRREMPRLLAIAGDCQPAVILCNQEYHRLRRLGSLNDLIRLSRVCWPKLPWLVTDRLAARGAAPFEALSADPDAIAVLQYTSGSTGDPKGVMISHGNIAHQCASNRRRLGLSMDSRAVVWVPHYHDFGLISGIMSAFSGNGHLYLLSPLSFVTRPAVWCEVMSRVGATHTASPNFGYELAISKSSPEQRAQWDLSRLQVAMSAAEPINPDTVRRFMEAFSCSGFRPEAFCPAYGLAEHTVGVTVAGKARHRFDIASLEHQRTAVPVAAGERDANSVRELIGCGRPADVDLRIVDPDSRQDLGSGRVGEIWVTSPSKALGYFKREDASAQTFRARLADDAGGTEYLRTGDLGFLFEGELYVVGRIKDVIIIRGRNIFPQDIESSLLDLDPRLRPGGAAAFAIECRVTAEHEAREGLGLVVEIRQSGAARMPPPERELMSLISLIDQTLTAVHQVPPDRIVLCLPRTLVKTTSGKINRLATRACLLDGRLHSGSKVLADWQRGAANATGASRAVPRLGPVEPAFALDGIDADYAALITQVATRFRAMAGMRPKRLFHPVSTTLKGTMTVLPLAPVQATGSLDTPELFKSGRTFPVILRHANGVAADDAAWDNRGATVRVLDPQRPDALDGPILDLLLTSGRCFSSANARDFVAWMNASRAQREARVAREPHLGQAAWDMFRLPDAYQNVHYYSKTANYYLAEDGRAWLVRFRLINPEHPSDGGRLTPDGPLPPDQAGRLPGEQRSTTFLHERLQQAVASGAVRYRLQIQLRPLPTDPREQDAILDPTQAWDEAGHPWLDRAELVLTEIVDSAAIEPLSFNPAHAPAEVGLIPARSATESASLNHLRAVVYAITSATRNERPVPASLERFSGAAGAAPVAAEKCRVIVVGAGVSGLTTARALDARGYSVTVLERAGEVGGKARSVIIDGNAYDLGAHLCSRGYRHLNGLLEALGVATEKVSEVRLWDLDSGLRSAWDAPRLREEFMRYQHLKQTRFPEITRPGFGSTNPILSQSAASFFQEHGLQVLGRVTATGYTASGYGFADDPELSAYRVLKYAESATFCLPGDALEFTTPAGGFGRVWQAVADRLPDVRTACRIERIERDETGVTVSTGHETLRADYLVMACPPHAFDGIIDLDAAEKDLFGRTRYLDYATVILRASGLPQDGFFLVDNHLGDRRSIGHTVAFHHRYPGSDVYLFWVYTRPGVSDEALMEPIRDDVLRMGGTVLEQVDIYRWHYMPHFERRAGHRDLYPRLERLQGQRRTYWVGSLCNFELVENNMQYAAHIADMLDQRAGKAAASPAATVSVAESGALRAALTCASHEGQTELLIRFLAERLGRILRVPAATFKPAQHLLDLGLDSIRSVELFEAIRTEADIELAPLAIYEYATIGALAAHLAQLFRERASDPAMAQAAGSDRRSGQAQLHSASAFFDQLLTAGAASSIQSLFLQQLAKLVTRRTGVAPAGIDAGTRMSDLGLDSITSVGLFDELMRQSRMELPPVILYEHPTLGSLSAVLAREFTAAHTEHRRQPPTTGLPAPAADQRSQQAAVDTAQLLPLLSDRMARLESAMLTLQQQIGQWSRHLDGAGAERPAPAAGAVPAPRDATSPGPIAQTPTPWLRIHRHPGQRAAMRLICFHSAGMDAGMYDVWRPALPLDMELCAVQLPGRPPHMQPAITDMADLIAAIDTALKDYRDRPFALFGHSFGALVAFVYARHLRDRGGQLPARLLVASFWPPQAWVCRPEITAMMAGKVPPGLAADQQVMDSWSYTHAEPLPFPLTVFHGADDRLVPRKAIDEWCRQSSEATTLHVIDGGHFQLITDPLLFDIARSLLHHDIRHAPPSRSAACASDGALALSESEARWLAQHDAALAGPPATLGSWNLWDLIHIARVSADGKEQPEFPDVLALLIGRLQPDGSYGQWRSPYPYNNLVIAMATLSTLIQWQHFSGGRVTGYYPALQDQIMAAEAAGRDDTLRGVTLPYGRYFKFPGMFGQSLVPAFEAQRLLQRGAAILRPDVRDVLEHYAAGEAVESVERFFRFGEFALPFPECYPDAVIRSDRVRAFAERAYPHMPGFSAAFAARYYDVTRSEPARESLVATLRNGAVGGLRPAGRLQEVYFSLYYLNKTELDLVRWYPGAMRYLRETQKPYGVGIDELSMDVDVDSTAIAVFVSAKQGAECVIEQGGRALERLWDPARNCYRSTLGYFFNINMVLLAARATIMDPAASAEDKRRMWSRTRAQLDTRQWISVDHISPLYLWESVVSFLFEFEAQFPDLPTTHHHAALDQVLALQTASGGFQSYYFDSPDLEETALGLLALKAAAQGALSSARRREVDAAIDRAQAFLAPRFREVSRRGGYYPEQWIGPFMFSDPKMVESILVASLLKAPQCRWRDGDPPEGARGGRRRRAEATADPA